MGNGKYLHGLTHFFHNLAHFNGNFSRNTSIYFVKINVGNLEYCANIAFTASIIRDISPEATFQYPKISSFICRK
jgi:hypothetical protein